MSATQHTVYKVAAPFQDPLEGKMQARGVVVVTCLPRRKSENKVDRVKRRQKVKPRELAVWVGGIFTTSC